MRPTSSDLVMRDPAAAAILGVLGSPDFGIEGDYSLAHLSQKLAGRDIGHGMDRNASVLDADARHLRMSSRELERARKTEERLELLYPNHGSDEHIGRYAFSLNQELVLGATEAISMTNNPLTDIRPDRLIFNAPCYGFALINVIQAGNLSILVGGFEDAANYTQVAVNVHVSMPLITTSNRAQIGGTYSGLAPAPYTAGGSFLFTGTFQGPARMTI